MADLVELRRELSCPVGELEDVRRLAERAHNSNSSSLIPVSHPGKRRRPWPPPNSLCQNASKCCQQMLDWQVKCVCGGTHKTCNASWMRARWPGAGFVDTEIGCFMRPEGSHAETEV
jgi:hypothetical protein